ncbi:type II secretion system protein [Vibrio kyushuensis]|uniref:type II secretion system protein n=1 Tax=Vibrio kyushuensis TaxID=2910249 RepID=UPI003D09F0EA
MKRQQGFSLFEMVIVIAVVGLLSAAAIPSYFNVRDGAKEAIILNTGQAVISANASVLGEAILEGKDEGRTKIGEVKVWNGNIVLRANNLERALKTNLQVVNYKLFNQIGNEDTAILHGVYIMHREDYQSYKSSGTLPSCFVRAVQRKNGQGKPMIDTNTNMC